MSLLAYNSGSLFAESTAEIVISDDLNLLSVQSQGSFPALGAAANLNFVSANVLPLPSASLVLDLAYNGDARFLYVNTSVDWIFDFGNLYKKSPTSAPSSSLPSKAVPTASPTTSSPSSLLPSSRSPSSSRPSSAVPSKLSPPSSAPSSDIPSSCYPTSVYPSSLFPSSVLPSSSDPTNAPSSSYPSFSPTTSVPTFKPSHSELVEGEIN